LLRRLFGPDGEESPYFRDVLDHLLRVGESTDAMRDRLVGAFELYMAAINNRQNVTMKQFTVIAGIFLPLSVVTGFFGMNFGWMVDHIDSRLSFLLLGAIGPAVLAAVLFWVFVSRGLFRE
jgi:magnesium transporter